MRIQEKDITANFPILKGIQVTINHSLLVMNHIHKGRGPIWQKQIYLITLIDIEDGK